MASAVQKSNKARFIAFARGQASVYTNEPHGYDKANAELIADWQEGRDDMLARIQPAYYQGAK
jgi:hypothetical protein